jgi:hypothetical protein
LDPLCWIPAPWIKRNLVGVDLLVVVIRLVPTQDNVGIEDFQATAGVGFLQLDLKTYCKGVGRGRGNTGGTNKHSPWMPHCIYGRLKPEAYACGDADIVSTV